MPLSARIGETILNAALLSETEWNAYKKTRLQMYCCNARAYQRTSRLGTRHFVHAPSSNCCSEGESAEHLAAKAEIVKACHELGWNAVPEYQGTNWRADVYATRGRHRLAFEIQWSNQTLEETKVRQAVYGPDVKCCWLFRRLPTHTSDGLRSDKRIDLSRLKNARDVLNALPLVTAKEESLPMFLLSFSEGGFRVTVDDRTLSLQDFVSARLERRIRYCPEKKFSVREVELVVVDVGCWRCRSQYDVFFMREILRSDCGTVERIADDPCDVFSNWKRAKQVFTAEVRKLRCSVKRRFSETMRRDYSSFGCPRCDALYGNHYLRHVTMEHEDHPAFCLKKLSSSERRPEPHWCFPVNGNFCS